MEGADVVVIGGGIIGCATARELAVQGAKVILLERSDIASGASGRNHGLLFYPLNKTAEPLYQESMRMYRELAISSDIQVRLDYEPQGFLIVVEGQDQWAAAEKEARAASGGGVRTTRLEAKELFEHEPNLARDLEGGWLIEDGYRVDPAALTLALASEAREAGAIIRTHLPAKQIFVEGDTDSLVITDQGQIRCETVVLATGPWVPDLLRPRGIELPISGARGWLVLTEPIEPIANRLIESSGWHFIAGDPAPDSITVGEYADGVDRGVVGTLIQQNPTGHVLLGGTRIPTVSDEPGTDPTADIARRARRFMPKLADARILKTWSGIRPMTPDGLPIIGWAPLDQRLLVVGGHGGQGMILGGGSGRLAAQMILETEPFVDPGPFDPLRFMND